MSEVLTRVIREAEDINYGKKPAPKTRHRKLETVGNRATGRDNHGAGACLYHLGNVRN